jgi:hypothetical protein
VAGGREVERVVMRMEIGPTAYSANRRSVSADRRRKTLLKRSHTSRSFAGIGCLAANCAIELEDRFNPAIENAMMTAVLFVLAAAKLSLDLNVGALPETRGEFAELPESETAVPFGP